MDSWMSWCRTGLLVAFLAIAGSAQGQEREREGFGKVVLRDISLLLFPKVIGDCALLREYIRSGDFAALRHTCGDLCAVDAVYREALRLSWDNRAEALLISAFATLDHRRVGVHLPALGPFLWFPLTSEFDDDFDERVRALPSHLYPDTPPGIGGDRDKLQHFFGSAFLAYIEKENDPAEDIGDFVEWGEEQFIVGGVNDERDKRSNAQGRQFGLRLLDDESVAPTEFFFPPMPLRADDPSGAMQSEGSGCVPDTIFPVMEAQ